MCHYIRTGEFIGEHKSRAALTRDRPERDTGSLGATLWLICLVTMVNLVMTASLLLWAYDVKLWEYLN